MKITKWWLIIVILIGVALVSGLLLGLIGEAIGLSSGLRTVGVGIIVGSAAAFLIAQRKKSI